MSTYFGVNAWHSVLNEKALVGAFNQEKALVGAFSVIVKTGCGTDGLFYSTTGDTGGAHTSRLQALIAAIGRPSFVPLNGITNIPKMLLHVTCAYFAKEHGRSCLEVTHPSSELRTSFTRWALRHLPFSPRLLGHLKNMVQFNLSCH